MLVSNEDENVNFKQNFTKKLTYRFTTSSSRPTLDEVLWGKKKKNKFYLQPVIWRFEISSESHSYANPIESYILWILNEVHCGMRCKFKDLILMFTRLFFVFYYINRYIFIIYKS